MLPISSTDSPLVSTPNTMIDTAMITATAEISTNTPLDPIDPAATDVTKNGKKILLHDPLHYRIQILIILQMLATFLVHILLMRNIHTYR